MQIININDDQALCEKCGAHLNVLGKFTYIEDQERTPRTKSELCTCNSCGAEFTLQYDLFTPEGHISGFIFSGDVNDPTYNWQDQLTDGQKKEIGEHLKGCAICNEKLNHTITSEAWFSSIIHAKKK